MEPSAPAAPPDPAAGRVAFAAFEAELPFALGEYQRRALAALAEPGSSVIVVAPTGSGKSIVADAAVWQALSRGATAAYTSPLRALANQRFAQLTARWGRRAGLVTGDTVVRPGAPCRVMTAELFRTLALLPELSALADPVEPDAVPAAPLLPGDAGAAPAPAPPATPAFPDDAARRPDQPPAAGAAGAAGDTLRPFFDHLAWAIFDEAHYLSDPERGSAWEEAILATPATARILCLSATIGEPERLAAWLRWLGRPVTLIEAHERPVPLRHYLFLRGDLQPVLDEHWQRLGSFPFAGGWALARRRAARPAGGPPKRRRGSGSVSLPGLPTVPPDEWVRGEALAALGRLRERELTPTIAFVASRREAERLAAAARATFGEAAGGVAVHHAGVPAGARRNVEERLRAGDLWLVCGTTTLAAGLDVPARSVLLTSYGRFDGRAFTLLSPAEYRQLVGRAGRLGRDALGAAVLLPSPWHGFDEAFRALTAPLPPVSSGFRSTYATALAWWGGGADASSPAVREERLAAALNSTFDAFLRRTRGGRDLRGLLPPAAPDGPSRLQARALGRLLEGDGLVGADGRLTPRGAFVLRLSGGVEGRLLLRLLEDGAFEDLDALARESLLAATAEGTLLERDDPVARRYLEAQRRQVALERECGALLTPFHPPLVRPADAGDAPGPDAWRRRQAAAEVLERALRAGRHSGVALERLTWGPALLQELRHARHARHVSHAGGADSPPGAGRADDVEPVEQS